MPNKKVILSGSMSSYPLIEDIACQLQRHNIDTIIPSSEKDISFDTMTDEKYKQYKIGVARRYFQMILEDDDISCMLVIKQGSTVGFNLIMSARPK